jgi:peroxiredoxin
MKRESLIIGLFTFLFLSNIFAQKDTLPSDSAPKMTLKADDETKFYDENKKEITRKDFKLAQETGKFTIEPVIGANAKLLSVSLKSTKPSLADFSEAKSFQAKNLKGETVSLESLKGKIIVINFWFIACAPCLQEIPDLNALVEKFKNNPDVVFLAPTFDEVEKVREFVERKNFQYSIIPQAKTWIADYNISNFPTHLIIDKQGTIAFSQINAGKNVVEQLQKNIETLLVQNVKRIETIKETPKPMGEASTKTADTDELLDGFFTLTNKTIIQDEEGKRIDNRTAGNLLNNDDYVPYKRKTKEGEIIIIKKKKK